MPTSQAPIQSFRPLRSGRPLDSPLTTSMKSSRGLKGNRTLCGVLRMTSRLIWIKITLLTCESLLHPLRSCELSCVFSKFKAPKRLNGKQGTPQATTNGNGRKSSPNKIGAFENIILNATDLCHRCEYP